MRLFGKVDGVVDRLDRPFFFILPFDKVIGNTVRVIGRLSIGPKYNAVMNVQERYSFVAATNYGS